MLRGKQRQRVSIGKWPDLTVGEARAEAKRLLIEEVQPQQAGIRFEKARDAFLDHYGNPNTRYIVTSAFRTHCKALEGTWLADITEEDIRVSQNTTHCLKTALS